MEISSLTKNIFDSAPWGIHLYRIDEKGDLIFSGTNPAADRILNLDNNQFVGKTLEEAFPLWKGKEIPVIYKEVATSGNPWSGEQINYNEGKISGVFRVHAFRVFPGWVAVAFEDVTESQKIKNELELKSKQFEKMSSQVPGMIYTFKRDKEGKYSVPYSSDKIKDVFGCSPEEVRNDFSPILKVIYKEDLDKLVKSIEDSYNNNKEWLCEYRVQLPDGSTRWMSGRSTIEKKEDGEAFWYGFNMDITDKKFLEEETGSKLDEFSRLNKLMIGRETKMIELKKENEELKSQINTLMEEIAKNKI